MNHELVEMIIMELEIRINQLSKLILYEYKKEKEFNFIHCKALECRKNELESMYNFVTFHKERLKDEYSRAQEL